MSKYPLLPDDQRREFFEIQDRLNKATSDLDKWIQKHLDKAFEKEWK